MRESDGQLMKYGLCGEAITEDSLVRNLEDAGCDRETVERFLILEKEGKTKEQLRLLSAQRDQLLTKVHQEERRIDCLDYLVFQIRKSHAN